jgi:putative acetyltransferase
MLALSPHGVGVRRACRAGLDAVAAMSSGFLIERGFKERDRAAVAALLREYEASLGISLCFQNFDAEVASLPGQYAPPKGEMLLLREGAGGPIIGCVALRSVPDALDKCEMKRLYVRHAARGYGLGRRLAVAAMATAHEMGYRCMCLDTLPTMQGAQALYRSLGFRFLGATASEPQVLLFERPLDGEDLESWRLETTKAPI